MQQQGTVTQLTLFAEDEGRKPRIPNGKRKYYGVPYKGSKNQLAENLCDQIPSADIFIDLFAGGCAVTHRMLQLNKYKRYIANDLDGQGVTLFCDAAKGKYHDETRWITREEFLAKKATDSYIAIVWSFGNNQKDYLYSKEITEWKHALHLARVFGDFSLLREMGINGDGSRADVVAHKTEYKEKYIKWWISKQQYLLRALKASGPTQREVGQRLGVQMDGNYFGKSQWTLPQSLQSLQSLERLERLQSLQSLERLERLEVSRKDYREVEIPDGAVVYGDPPYKGTNQYKNAAFDSAAFYDWCGKQKTLVIISEYAMPDDRFACVWSKTHTSKICSKGASKCVERLFVPRHQLALYRQLQNREKMRQLSLFAEEFTTDGSIIFTRQGQNNNTNET